MRALALAALVALATLSGCSSSGTGDDPVVDTGTAASLCTNDGACSTEGNGCTGVTTCRACGSESWVSEAPRCICKAGKWACTLTDCGPFTPSTYSDPECKTRRDAGVPDTSPTDTAPDDTGSADTGVDAPAGDALTDTGPADSATDASSDATSDASAGDAAGAG